MIASAFGEDRTRLTVPREFIFCFFIFGLRLAVQEDVSYPGSKRLKFKGSTMRVFILGIFGIFLNAGQDALAAPQSALSPYREVQSFLQKTVQQNPKNATLFTLGVSDSGEAIQGIQVGNGPIHNLVVATHHGNEYGSTEVAKGFGASIAASPIAGQTVYVIPVLNIAGYNAGQRQETAKGRSFDPNRDYPGPCGTNGPHRLKSTALLARFIDQKAIVASATLHTYFPAVVYPWGISSHDLTTHYDGLFLQLAKASTVESGYQVGNSTEIIYPADGTYEDYAFWRHGIWSLLFELGSSHNPSGGDVAEMVRTNVPGLRRMLEQAPRERAQDHGFSGKCDAGLAALDLHNE